MSNHEHFMRIALVEAEKALAAGDFPVGCVFAEDNTVLASGRRQNSGGDNANELDHAEVLTLHALLQERPRYDLSKVIVYSTMEPCLMCFTTLLLSGIRNFVWAYEDVMGGGTNLPLDSLAPLYSAMNISTIPRILRNESLALFQEFFRNYSYWADSPLAKYTLDQKGEV